MRIICILGKSGSGKSTIEKKLEILGYNRIISYTTRKPRGKEVSGKEYHFVNTEQFKSLIEKNILMEYAEYAGNMYGAPRPVGSINNVIVVESDGYRKIKQLYSEQAIGIYVDVSDELADERKGIRHDTSDTDAVKRRKSDNEKFMAVKEEVDLVVDGTKNPEDIVIEILQYIKRNN